MKRLVIVLLLIIACKSETLRAASYDQEIEQWRAHRREGLTAANGWLSLVGLYWLHDGANDITLPSHPPASVRFMLRKGEVTLEPNRRLGVNAPMQLLDDTDPKGPTVVHSGTLSFEAIRRADIAGDHYGIRARDPEGEARAHFKGLEYFPPNPAFRVEARFEPYRPPKKIAITNVLGMTSEETAPGTLIFTLHGRTYRIDPILEQGETDLFIIFKDATSGHETYHAARYLYAHPPDAAGKTIVDFNKSYNPPCAFTPYATCPLPPKQNRLPIRIEAGEKAYEGK